MRRFSPKTQASLKDFLIRNQTVLLLLVLLNSSCSTPIPKWDGKLYAGDPAHDGVTRAQANETISCQAPEFNQMICMTMADFRSFYATYVLGCKDWQSGMLMMTIDQAQAKLKAETGHNF